MIILLFTHVTEISKDKGDAAMSFVLAYIGYLAILFLITFWIVSSY